jgi:hypothetical protein
MQDHFEEVKASFARNQASAFGLLKQMVTELQTLANSNPEVGDALLRSEGFQRALSEMRD